MEQVYSFDEFSIPLWIKALFGGLYMVIFVYAAWKTLLKAPKDKRKVKVSALFILLYFTAYAMFYCVNPDYFSYRDWVSADLFDLATWTREMVYAYIIIFCRLVNISYPFELFRFIVWGGALLLVSLTARLYRDILVPSLVLLFLFVFYSGTFSYARSSLAMAVYFLGVGIIMGEHHFFIKLLGLGLAICSYFFHHEMIIGIGILPSLIVPFEKKKTVLLSFLLLLMMIGAIVYINSNLALVEAIFGDDEISQKMETYNERGAGIFRISTFISYFNIFYPFILTTSYFFKRKHVPKTIAGMYRITLVLLLATIAFSIVSGARSTYTYRVLYIAIVPMAFLIAYCYTQGYIKKHQFAFMLMLAVITNLMRLIQSV